MKRINHITIICISILSFIIAGCQGWLDVKPIDRILEDQLYETEEGFKQSLNGIYIDLNQGSLYGGDLMFSMVDILAQRYNISDVGSNRNIAQFKYSENDVKLKLESTWKQAYVLIMNCNKLIENADRKRPVFTGNNYDIIVGEAKALRAFLHFDLLRLFGPVYSLSPEVLAIPYNTSFSLAASEILSARQVIELVLKDLEEAQAHLSIDPIIEFGPQNSDSPFSDNTDRYRTLRMNYYAVKGLRARVYLYAGQKQEALVHASEILEIQEKWFPLVNFNAIMEGSNKSKDRMFSTELLFAAQNRKRGDIFDNNFSSELESNRLLAPADASLRKVFPSDGDWRLSPFWIMPESGKHTFRCFHKFQKPETLTYHAYLVPLLRVSEMVYIVAETSDNYTDVIEALNRLRRHRGQVPFDLTANIDVESYLNEEYQREFFGEGQLFFYYKRLFKEKIAAGNGGVDVAMDVLKYVLPIPNSEIDYRN